MARSTTSNHSSAGSGGRWATPAAASTLPTADPEATGVWDQPRAERMEGMTLFARALGGTPPRRGDPSATALGDRVSGAV